MHHQDFSGDSSGSRKMSHPTVHHHRRGSNSASASSATGSGGYVSTEDNQPPPLSTNQAGSSSPGHPQSLNVAPQSQTVVKKKSGFQITSVTPAQVSVSTNNSIADDTESYDDMDESHTEDLSSSDMLDVSVSRATDTGLPERSSSDETLNSLHGVETPGIVSPNEPLHPHSIPQASQQQQGALVNGTTHHHHHQHSHDPLHVKNHQQGHQQETKEAVPPPVSAPGGLSSAGGASPAQRVPLMDNFTGGLAPQPVTIVTVGAGAEKHLSGNMSKIAAQANVSVLSGSGVPSSLGPLVSDSAEHGTATGAGGLPGGTGSSSSQAGVAGGSVAQPVTTTTHPQTQAAPGSRFRVVKLDSNSEPFRKGRWMCTEYYEKEVLPAASEPSPAPKPGEVVPSEGEPAGMVASVGPAAVPQTLQPYQQQTQDYTSPQAIQAPPHVGPQEAGSLLVQPGQSCVAPSTTLPAAPQVISQGTVTQAQSFPYAVDTLQGQAQTAYPAPQHSAGLLTMGGGRQPDFIQPTAPFQTQAQGPLAPASTGVAMTGPGGVPPVAVTQPLPLQGQTPPSQAGLAQAQTQQLPAQRLLPQSHPASTPRVTPSTHGTPYMPLTTLQADLQPLLTHGMALSQPPGGSHHHGGAPHMSSIASLTATQLQDAQRLLFQHQSLVGLPRLGAPGGGERTTEARGAGGGGLGQMGMVGDASALVAAAAGLRTQPADEEEDR